MTETFKKVSYEKKLGLYFSLLTSLILKYFQVRVSSKTNWRNRGEGVISWREQWPPLSCPRVWIILEYWNSYKKCFVRIKRAKKKTVTTTVRKKKRLNRCCIFIVQGMKFLLQIIRTKGLWQCLRQLSWTVPRFCTLAICISHNLLLLHAKINFNVKIY